MPDDERNEEEGTEQEEGTLSIQEKGVGEMFDFTQGLPPDEGESEDTEDDNDAEGSAKEQEESPALEEEQEEEAGQEESTDEQEGQDDSEKAEEEEADESEVSKEDEDLGEEEEEFGEEESDDEDPRDQVIANLTARLDKLEKGEGDEPAKKEEIPIPEIPDDFQVQILGDHDLDDITSDPKLFAEVLQKAIAIGRDMTHEYVLKSLPGVVMTQTQNYSNLQKLRYRFYKENKELKPFKNAVAQAANEIYADDPSLSFEQVMEKAADKTRTALKIKKGKKRDPGKDKPKGKKQKPGFAKAPKGKKAKQQTSKMQKQLDDLM